jgi:hypothetical protein
LWQAAAEEEAVVATLQLPVRVALVEAQSEGQGGTDRPVAVDVVAAVAPNQMGDRAEQAAVPAATVRPVAPW